MSATASLQRSLETLAPFRRSAERDSAIPATLEGKLPGWLRGEVVRTCPAVFETKDWRAQHWFDGLGMVYAFRIGAATVDFRSRLLDSQAARDAARGETNLSTFGTRTTRGLLRRLFSPLPRVTDNTNLNIVSMGEQLVALTGGNRQHVIDHQTLCVVDTVEYEKDALGTAIVSAHPQLDPERGVIVNVATELGVGGALSVYEHAPSARQRKVVGSWRTNRVPYVHSFGLTPRKAVLVAHPFTASPMSVLWSGKGYGEHFAWHPEHGTRLIVLDRATGKTREHHCDAFFAFHTVNAFDVDGATILDLLAYPNADVMAALRVERMLAKLPDLRPSLLRITMRPGVERASVEKLSDTGFEFPAINHEQVSGRPYRFAWGTSGAPRPDGTYASAIVKVDLEARASTSFAADTHIFGEPLFVARPGATAEDDGVLLTVGSAQTGESSTLAILDARTMTLVASAEVPAAIPLGFHGCFVPR